MTLFFSRLPSPGLLATRHLVAPALLSAALLFAGNASAAPSLAEKATAQALFEDGLQLMGAKRYAEACPKLEESERLDPALGTRFRLSECEELIGRLASAWAGFLEVADLAHASGQLDREALAKARAAAIEPKLSRVKVDVATPDTPGLEVAHDSTVVGKAQWGTPGPIDPGTYTVTATAPGKKPWHGSVTVGEGGATASLVVPALDNAPVEPVPAAVPLNVGVVGGAAGAEPQNHIMRNAGFAVTGVGAAGLIMGGVLGLIAKGNYNGAGSNCTATTCNASGESTINSARSLANVGTAVFIGGAVVAAAGVVVVVVAPSSKSKGSASAAVRLGPGSALLEGSF